MSACNELAELLSAHASGDCSAEERERVEAHLEGCADCAAERESLAETLALATLPKPGELELHALGALPGQVHAAWKAQQRTRRTYWRATVGGVMAIAASLLVLVHAGPVPDFFHSSTSSDDTELSVEALADGPVSMDDDAADDAPLPDDPEVAPTPYSDEGDD